MPLKDLEKAFAALPHSDKKKCRGWRSGKAMRTRMLDIKRIVYHAQREAASQGATPKAVMEDLEAECMAMPKSVSTLISPAGHDLVLGLFSCLFTDLVHSACRRSLWLVVQSLQSPAPLSSSVIHLRNDTSCSEHFEGCDSLLPG